MTMSKRYIDAEHLKRLMLREWEILAEDYKTEPVAGRLYDLVDRELTADVVEVVRCEKCKHGQYDCMLDCYWCNGEAHTDAWFCAGGERRE